jgi:hypothetical protein
MTKCVAVGPRFVPESALPRKMSVLPVNVERISRELYGLARRRDDFPHQLFWEARAKGMLMPFPEVDAKMNTGARIMGSCGEMPYNKSTHSRPATTSQKMPKTSPHVATTTVSETHSKASRHLRAPRASLIESSRRRAATFSATPCSPHDGVRFSIFPNPVSSHSPIHKGLSQTETPAPCESVRHALRMFPSLRGFAAFPEAHPPERHGACHHE